MCGAVILIKKDGHSKSGLKGEEEEVMETQADGRGETEKVRPEQAEVSVSTGGPAEWDQTLNVKVRVRTETFKGAKRSVRWKNLIYPTTCCIS